MKNKPIPEGYKIYSLCDTGYTYTFMFSSRVEEDTHLELIAGINKAGCTVCHLANQLPHNKTFYIYMDNYFSSIPLFKHLHENNIGHAELRIVTNDVLTILWIDNGPVTMLTTIHEAIVYQVFGNLSRKELAISRVIDDYNNFMEGVDLADQLRGYYNCQLTVRRTWFPLFFWLLDTVLVN
ncbi:1944_t:CDS:2, partial [Dentiscutata erythropus]